MASRFWERGNSSEDEEEDGSTSSSRTDETFESNSDEASSDASTSSESNLGRGKSKFLVGSDSSDDEVDKRIVRSAKDRRGEELKSTCDEIRNKMHINDWSSIQSLFDKLNKQMEKTLKTEDILGAPRPYIRLLHELENFISKSWDDKPAKKKMSATNSRALTTMRQRVKKHNAGYQKELLDISLHPVSSSENEQEGAAGTSSDSDAITHLPDTAETAFERIRFRQEKKRDKILTMNPDDIDYAMVSNKLSEAAMTRGKKGVDRVEQVEMLEFLLNVSRGPLQQLEVLVHLVSALFDLTPSMTTHMPIHLWKRCVGTLFQVLNLLKIHPNIVMDEKYDGGEDNRTAEPAVGEPARLWGNLVANVERLDDEFFKSLQVIDPHTHKFMHRMQDEPLLLALAQQTSNYLEQQNDLRALSRIALRRIEHLYYKTDSVYESIRNHAIAQQDAQRQDADLHKEGLNEEKGDLGDEDVEADTAAHVPVQDAAVAIPQDLVMDESIHELVTRLISLVYQHGDERTKARTSICATYMRCIHDEFHTARDMLLMSHLQDNVQQMDVSTQILYNRAMGQLGLCAFRAGLISEAYACLSELYSSGRVKELLAQGMALSRWQEKTPEQEKIERRRQMPFHMHINLELLESCHLICAMLLEVPNIAANTLDTKRRIISKHFRRLVDNYNRQTFTGPPENVRDHVMAATKALSCGNWLVAYNHLEALPVWDLMPRRTEVLLMLKHRVQSEALRSYLFAFGLHYSSISLDQLAAIFQQPPKKIHSIVSKMMMEEAWAGSWDQPTRTVVMHNAEPSQLQMLASDLSDRVSGLVDLNERALQLRTGGLREDDDGAAGPYGESGIRSIRGRGRGRGRGFLLQQSDRDGGRGRGGRGGRGGGRFNAQYGYVSGYARASDFDRGTPVLTQLGTGRGR